MDIIFVRHGKPNYDLADSRQMGQLEKDYAPLDRDCIPFIKQQAQNSVFQDAELIVSSPYTRALQTAEILNRQLNLELFVEHDLREWLADLNGGYITLKERDRRWEEYRETVRSNSSIASSQYEAASSVRARALSVLHRYSEYRKIVVVSHFNVLESIIGFQADGIECGCYLQFTLDHFHQ
ncbi:histidine phosphatase family protein [Vibrio vulnificus]|nr:histidine phosphatase family protein [Vibrio vulnificus]HAS8118920.1 histidine phosphatase family protein [Vibrio vulnificus]